MWARQNASFAVCNGCRCAVFGGLSLRKMDSNLLWKLDKITGNALIKPFTAWNVVLGARKAEMPTFKCPNCAVPFTTIDGLEDHVADNHPNAMPFKCGQCTRKTATAQGLLKHYHLHHGTKKVGFYSTILDKNRILGHMQYCKRLFYWRILRK